jgi:hypothetical protein
MIFSFWDRYNKVHTPMGIVSLLLGVFVLAFTPNLVKTRFYGAGVFYDSYLTSYDTASAQPKFASWFVISKTCDTVDGLNPISKAPENNCTQIPDSCEEILGWGTTLVAFMAVTLSFYIGEIVTEMEEGSARKYRLLRNFFQFVTVGSYVVLASYFTNFTNRDQCDAEDMVDTNMVYVWFLVSLSVFIWVFDVYTTLRTGASFSQEFELSLLAGK